MKTMARRLAPIIMLGTAFSLGIIGAAGFFAAVLFVALMILHGPPSCTLDTTQFQQKTGVVVGSVEYQYFSDRNLNGDGYSLVIFHVPQEEIARVQATPRIFRYLSQAILPPPLDSYSLGNSGQRPFDSQMFRLAFEAPPGNPEFNKRLDELSHLFQEGTALYGGFVSYYPMAGLKEQITGDIDLYVIDPEKGLLYAVNHNT